MSIIFAMSELRLIRRCAQWLDKAEIPRLPRKVRGIYTLLFHRTKLDKYDVVYVGMGTGEGEGVRGRLVAHSNSKGKRDLWTHFSVFEVWPNISETEIEELEGLFREIYRKDKRANRLNRQKRYKKLQKIRIKKLDAWNQY